jgi:hypothetical protein
VGDHGTSRNDAAGQDNRVLHVSACLDPSSSRQVDRRADLRSRFNRRVVGYGHRSQQLGARADIGAGIDVDTSPAGEQVVMGQKVALWRAHIQPVAGQEEAEESSEFG